MNYLIVMPKMVEEKDSSYWFPLGIAYVSASLKQTGRNVVTYNLTYKDGTIEENLEQIINENDIDVIATGGLTGQYWQLKKILGGAKEIKPSIITLIGGGIITSDPENAMEAVEIADYGMIGEGEVTICELAEALEGKRTFESVAGLIYKKEGVWYKTAPRAEITDLDSLPYPDYEGFNYAETLDKKVTDVLGGHNGRFATVSFGRSCPFNCTFCFHPSGTTYRKRSLDSIFKEIDYLIEHYHIQNISVTDELFLHKEVDLLEFCNRIKERKLGFIISLRVDMVNRKMLIQLRDSGCLLIQFGLESADNTILKSMRKNITVEQIDKALSLCNELGINCSGNFIFGDQNETVETANNTIRWWREHPQYKIKMHLITVYPGSELYKIALQKGIIKDPVKFIKDGCPYINVSKMSDKEYKDMSINISMQKLARTESLLETEYDYLENGKVKLEGLCPECYKKNIWNDIEVFASYSSLRCNECGKIINTVCCDYIGDVAEDNFKKLKSYKIAIWPMVSAVTEFVEKVPSALGENVFFVDKASAKQGATYKGKVINSPSIIESENIDIVFVAAAPMIAVEIMKEIKETNSRIRVFRLGDLVNTNFIENNKLG